MLPALAWSPLSNASLACSRACSSGEGPIGPASRSTNCLIWLSGWAPMKPSTGCPLSKANTAGIDWMRSCCAISGFSSILTLTSATLPPASRTVLSRTGASCLHGPHQGAQKSTITGVWCDASITSAAKLWVVVSFGCAAPPAAWPMRESIAVCSRLERVRLGGLTWQLAAGLASLPRPAATSGFPRAKAPGGARLRAAVPRRRGSAERGERRAPARNPGRRSLPYLIMEKMIAGTSGSPAG